MDQLGPPPRALTSTRNSFWKETAVPDVRYEKSGSTGTRRRNPFAQVDVGAADKPASGDGLPAAQVLPAEPAFAIALPFDVERRRRALVAGGWTAVMRQST